MQTLFNPHIEHTDTPSVVQPTQVSMLLEILEWRRWQRQSGDERMMGMPFKDNRIREWRQGAVREAGRGGGKMIGVLVEVRKRRDGRGRERGTETADRGRGGGIGIGGRGYQMLIQSLSE
eukprot:2853283-Rhodomonas_salina.3